MKLAALGEVMVELAPQAVGPAHGVDGSKPLLRQSFAGDTFNTAVYIARSGVSVSYVTLLGDDPYSDEIQSRLQSEGIDIGGIEQLPGRCPGLYMIQNSADGERYFTYWRGESPARQLFAAGTQREAVKSRLREMDCIYLSGITLAIMQSQARTELLDFLREFRGNGGRVAFDSNYRSRLWDSVEVARDVVMEFLQQTDIALFTFEDEQALWADTRPAQSLKRNCRAGIAELVLKRGPEPVLLQRDGQLSAVDVPPVPKVVDTTGAGDSFNAGYLAARLQGASPLASIAEGNRYAAQVIGYRGAIIPRAENPVHAMENSPVARTVADTAV
ncbi:sugar kinase [Microbulbifer agarilyticus]